MTTPHYQSSKATLYAGDCLDILRELPDASVDSVVTDPPYGLSNTDPTHVAETITRWVAGDREYLPGGKGFMGKDWDAFVPPVAVWDECMRVLKPGGHLLAFAGSRTMDLMTLSIRLAGFDIRDSIAWLYGSGFPKSQDVSKAIDRKRDDSSEVLAVTRTLSELAAAAGISRKDIDAHMGTSDMGGWWLSTLPHRCALPSVENWTRLRDYIPGAPELDPEVWRLNGRKGCPGEAWASREIIGQAKTRAGDGTVIGLGHTGELNRATSELAQQWEGWGTALKPAFEPVVVARKPFPGTVAANVLTHGTGALNIDASRIAGDPWKAHSATGLGSVKFFTEGEAKVIDKEPHGGGRFPANVILDESQAEALDQQSGTLTSGSWNGKRTTPKTGGILGSFESRDETPRQGDTGGASRFFYTAKAPGSERPTVDGVAHPTVKPLDLMQYLVRLVTPPGGTVLEPFAGSGTTAEACVIEGFQCIAIERDTTYLPLIVARLEKDIQPTLFGLTP